MPQPRPSLPPFLVRVGNALELIIERCLFGARWLLAPFYVGLALALVVLMVKFVEEFWHLAIHGVAWSEAQVILGVLTLIDLALTGSLLVIVIFSGYENFVSKIDHSTHEDWPSWMGTIDFAALKLKLLSSIVAISAIHLLKQFMEIKTLYKSTEVSIADRQLFWYVVIHLIFVFSSVLLALSDRIAGSHGDHGPTPHQPPSPQPQQQPRSTAEHATGTTAPVTRAHDA